VAVFDLGRLLLVLSEEQVEFIIVGGVAAAQRVRVLSLRRLVELKRALARPKDLAMLPVLEATLREREG
jgi:hypothetical protein